MAYLHPAVRAILVKRVQSVPERYCLPRIAMHYGYTDRLDVDRLGTRQNANVVLINEPEQTRNSTRGKPAELLWAGARILLMNSAQHALNTTKKQ